MPRNKWTDEQRASEMPKLDKVRRKRWKRFSASGLGSWAGVKVRA